MYVPKPNELLSFLLSRSPQAVAMCDRQMRYLLASPQWLTFYGLAEDNSVPKGKFTPHQLFPHQPDRFEQALQNCLAGRTDRGNDGQFVRPDGEVIPLQWEMQPWRNRNGKIGGAIVCVEAIDQTASDRENRDRLFVEQAADSIFIADIQARFVRVNPQACQILGYSKAELLRLSVPDIVAPSDRARIGVDLAQVMAGETICIEAQFLHRDGTIFTAEVSAKKLGENLVQAIIRDITSRVQMQAALKASEARFQKLAANMPGVIYQFILHPDGSKEIPYISCGCRELYELEPETIQQNIDFLWATAHPEDLSALDRSIAISATNLTPWHHEHRIITPSGKLKWIEGFSRPEKLPGGEILWDGLVIDVSQRKQAEKALQQYRENLEELVAERTRKLTEANKQLQTEIQERQIVQKALRQSQERFTKLAANVPGMIYQYVLRPDRSDYFSYVSPGCRELCELEAEEILQNSSHIHNLVHPNDREKFWHSIFVSAQTLQPWNMELRLVTLSGQIKWVQGVSRPEKQANGDIIWDGLLIDISKRKQAEEKLQESENRLQKLTANVPGMLYQFVLRPDGSNSLSYVNSGCLELYEIEPSAVQENSQLIWDLVHPDDLPHLKGSIAISAQTLTPWHHEHRIITPSGKVKWIRGASRSELQPNGDIIWDGLVMDISDRKAAEKALQESEAKFRIILEMAPIPIIITRQSDGEIFYVNSQVALAIDLSVEECLGRKTSNFYYDLAARQTMVSTIAKNGYVRNYEVLLKKADGTPFWATMSAQPLVLNNQEVLLTAFFDITKRKQTEEALQRAYQQVVLLKQITEEIRASLDTKQILQTTVDRVGQVFGASRCLIQIYKSEPFVQLPFVAEYVAPEYSSILGMELTVDNNPHLQRILAQDRAIVSDNVYTEPLLENAHSICHQIQLKSMLAIRTSYQGEPNGMLVLHQCNRFRNWTKEEIELFEAVANQVGIALFQAQLLEQQTTAREQLAEKNLALQESEARFRNHALREALLNRLSSQIRQSLDLDTVLEIAVGEIRQLLQVDRCQFVWYRQQDGFSCYEAVKESKNPELESHNGAYKLAATGSPDILLARELLRLDDSHWMQNPVIREFFLIQNYQAVLSLPVQARSGELGFVNCSHGSVRHWHDEEVELLGAVADQLAIAIDQAELYKQTRTAAAIAQAQAQRQELLNRLVSQIRASLDLDTILETAVSEVYKLLQPDRCIFVWYRLEIPSPYSEVVHEVKKPELRSLLGMQTPFNRLGAIAQRILNKQMFRIDDVQALPEEHFRQFFASLGIRSALVLPIHTQSGEVGLFSCSQIAEARTWSDGEVELLSNVADQLAIAIDQAELYKQTRITAAIAQAQAQRQELLNRLVSQIRASLDIKNILETAVGEIYKLLQLDRCMFVWYRMQKDEPLSEIVCEVKNPELPSFLGMHLPLDSLGFVAQNVLNKEITLIEDFTTVQKADVREKFLKAGYYALVAMPVHTQSGEIGVISCSQTKEPRQWTDSEIELLSCVGDQLAIAINQAELYSRATTSAQIATEHATKLEVTLQELKKAQTHLIQSEKMSSLGQMVAGIAHEINNPVSFIYGNVAHADEYIKNLLHLIHLYQHNYPQPATEIRQFLDSIDLDFFVEDLPKVMNSMKIGATRIKDIVRSLRSFSRLDEADLKPVSLHEGIDNTLLILEHRLKANASRSAIQVIKEYAELPLVECYAGQLNQVFMNLLTNAIDALEEKIAKQKESKDSSFTPKILIHTEIAPGDWIICRIMDNGSGISDEVLPRLFDPFFTTKPVGYGTGMGLAISYQIIVERHQGRLTCRSQKGSETEFIIEIPLRRTTS